MPAQQNQQFIVPPDQILTDAQMLAEDVRLIELSQQLPSGRAALNFLAQRGLIHNSYLCLTCGTQVSLCAKANTDGFHWRCRRCGTSKSVRADSFFAKSNLPLSKIILMLYCWAVRCSQKWILHEFRISQDTAVNWCVFFREIAEVHNAANPIAIGGVDYQTMQALTVEIDESYFFHRKYHRGAFRQGFWVFGGIERESRRCFAVQVQGRDRRTLEALIQQYILPGTRIISDAWAAYARVDQIQGGVYAHDVVVHQHNFVDPDDNTIHTNTVEGMWSHMKEVFRTMHGTCPKHFQSYIDEFLWHSAYKENYFPAALVTLRHQF